MIGQSVLWKLDGRRWGRSKSGSTAGRPHLFSTQGCPAARAATSCLSLRNKSPVALSAFFLFYFTSVKKVAAVSIFIFTST